MSEVSVTIKVSKDFHEWWLKQPYCNDEGLMYVSWNAWNACETKYKDYNKSSKVQVGNLCGVR